MIRLASLIVASLIAAMPAAAQVKIGLLVSATGPTAAIGVPQKNTGDLLPKRLGDLTVEYVQLEDGADSTRALQNAKKLIGESNVDAIIGPSTTPAALAILDTIAESKVPLLATVGSSNVVEPMDAKRRWVFKTTQNDDLIASALIAHMKKAGVKTLGFIGFNDPYGENWYRVFQPMAEKEGIRIVASERYARTDQSVTGQSLKLIGAKPDAMFIAAVDLPSPGIEETTPMTRMPPSVGAKSIASLTDRSVSANRESGALTTCWKTPRSRARTRPPFASLRAAVDGRRACARASLGKMPRQASPRTRSTCPGVRNVLSASSRPSASIRPSARPPTPASASVMTVLGEDFLRAGDACVRTRASVIGNDCCCRADL